MKLTDFALNVEGNKDLVLTGVESEDNNVVIFVQYKPTGQYTKLPLDVIIKYDWEVLEPVLLFKQEPDNLVHISRVVGYYSRIENWNKSKVGELRDRQKGNYVISGNLEG